MVVLTMEKIFKKIAIFLFHVEFILPMLIDGLKKLPKFIVKTIFKLLFKTEISLTIFMCAIHYVKLPNPIEISVIKELSSLMINLTVGLIAVYIAILIGMATFKNKELTDKMEIYSTSYYFIGWFLAIELLITGFYSINIIVFGDALGPKNRIDIILLEFPILYAMLGLLRFLPDISGTLIKLSKKKVQDEL